MNTHTTHTPGPWKVMADPNHKGKHPFHDSRWIATTDAEVESSEFVPMDWGLEKGSLICMMRDGPTANAHLIAASPDLLAACEFVRKWDDMHPEQDRLPSQLRSAVRAALSKARGEA